MSLSVPRIRNWEITMSRQRDSTRRGSWCPELWRMDRRHSERRKGVANSTYNFVLSRRDWFSCAAASEAEGVSRRLRAPWMPRETADWLTQRVEGIPTHPAVSVLPPACRVSPE